MVCREKAETLTFLSHHGAAIFSHLEYFIENNTGNHLANNGRGLFLGGLELSLDQWADVGGRILIEEGRRIFTSNGLLREGSSHYHLLVTRWYASAGSQPANLVGPKPLHLRKLQGLSFLSPFLICLVASPGWRHIA